jgi:hypothetical protein
MGDTINLMQLHKGLTKLGITLPIGNNTGAISQDIDKLMAETNTSIENIKDFIKFNEDEYSIKEISFQTNYEEIINKGII